MEKKQILIAVDRSFGSDGEKIAELLGTQLGLKVYGRNLLHEALPAGDATEAARMAKWDEKPPCLFPRRRVRTFAFSKEEILADTEFHCLREKADRGESFIVIGHCGDVALAGRAALVRIFITSDWETRVKRVAAALSTSGERAGRYILQQDKKMETYHDNFTDKGWACSLHYDLCINSSRLGEADTVRLLLEYIDQWMGCGACLASC